VIELADLFRSGLFQRLQREPFLEKSAGKPGVKIFSGELQGLGEIVLQNRNQLMALRLLTAFLVTLLGWRLKQRSWIARLATITVLAVLAIAVVPLLPNQWQAVADGVVLGAALSLGMWMVCASCWCCESCVERFKTKFGGRRAEVL